MQDPTAKLTSPENQPDDRARTMGWLLLVAFGILVVTGLVPELKWLLFSRDASSSIWLEVLGVHSYWIGILCFLVSGLDLLAGRSRGVLLGIVACIFWLGMRGFTFLYFLGSAENFLTNVQVTSGLTFPPNTTSLGVLGLNVLSILCLITLADARLAASLAGGKGKVRAGLLMAIALCIWSIICFYLKQALMPPLDMVYFQF